MHAIEPEAYDLYLQIEELYKQKFNQDLVLTYDDDVLDIAFKGCVMGEEQAKNLLEFVKQLNKPLVKPQGFDQMVW